MLKNLVTITPEEINKSAKEATSGPIIAMQSNMESSSDQLAALHYGKKIVNENENNLY